MFTKKHINHFSTLETPFYFYDIELLKKTLGEIKRTALPNYNIHYALKANAHPTLLEIIKNAGLGADCVSGNEGII